MITLKSNTKLSKAAWQSLEEYNATKGIKKCDILSESDTYAVIEMTDYKLTNKFSANLKYRQLKEYQELDENENPVTREIPILMFDENFVLEGQSLQDLWEYLEGDTTLIVNVENDLMDFYLAGFIARLGLNSILGLTSADWDVIDNGK